jgi:hypothetical protein
MGSARFADHIVVVHPPIQDKWLELKRGCARF